MKALANSLAWFVKCLKCPETKRCICICIPYYRYGVQSAILKYPIPASTLVICTLIVFFFLFFYYYFCNIIFTVQISNLLSIISPFLPHLSFPRLSLELMELKKECHAALPSNSPLDIFSHVLYLTAQSLFHKLPRKMGAQSLFYPTTPQSCFCHLYWTRENERTLPTIIVLFMQWYVAWCADHHVSKILPHCKDL